MSAQTIRYSDTADGDSFNSKTANLPASRCTKCFPCHEPGKGLEFVFTDYAPAP